MTAPATPIQCPAVHPGKYQAHAELEHLLLLREGSMRREPGTSGDTQQIEIWLADLLHHRDSGLLDELTEGEKSLGRSWIKLFWHC